jgi:hypothetical protein
MGAEQDQHLVREDGAVMYHIRELVIDKTRENLVFIGGQNEDKVQLLKAIGKEGSQNEECVLDGDETNLSHIKEKPIIEINMA